MIRHVSLIVLSTAVYGLSLGWWRSFEMAFYVAVKLPVVFVGSTLIVSAFAWAAGLAVTMVRPMLAPVGTTRAPTGKCFFLAHFYQSMSEGSAR